MCCSCFIFGSSWGKPKAARPLQAESPPLASPVQPPMESILSQNFRQPAETRVNRLLVSADRGHVESIDQLPKRLMMVIKAKADHAEFHLN